MTDPADSPAEHAPGPFPGSIDAAVLAHLKAAKKPQSAPDVAAALSLPETSVKRAFGKLVAERLVRKAGGGLFALAAHPGHRQGRRD